MSYVEAMDTYCTMKEAQVRGGGWWGAGSRELVSTCYGGCENAKRWRGAGVVVLEKCQALGGIVTSLRLSGACGVITSNRLWSFDGGEVVLPGLRVSKRSLGASRSTLTASRSMAWHGAA